MSLDQVPNVQAFGSGMSWLSQSARGPRAAGIRNEFMRLYPL